MLFVVYRYPNDANGKLLLGMRHGFAWYECGAQSRVMREKYYIAHLTVEVHMTGIAFHFTSFFLVRCCKCCWFAGGSGCCQDLCPVDLAHVAGELVQSSYTDTVAVSLLDRGCIKGFIVVSVEGQCMFFAQNQCHRVLDKRMQQLLEEVPKK